MLVTDLVLGFKVQCHHLSYVTVVARLVITSSVHTPIPLHTHTLTPPHPHR